jgi:osmotically-inducible protein OsmY
MDSRTVHEPAAREDLQLRDAVIRELDADPRFDAAAIGVAAHRGAVTLTGSIDSYVGKLAAERAAQRVRGERVVANDIDVTLRHERSDADIAADIVGLLDMRPHLDGVQAAVHAGHVTLVGHVRNGFQRTVAGNVVGHVPGIKAVANRLVVGHATLDLDRILDALPHESDVPRDTLRAEIRGRVVTLAGSVPSWRARVDAERAITCQPGVARVTNHIEVVETEPDTVSDDIC